MHIINCKIINMYANGVFLRCIFLLCVAYVYLLLFLLYLVVWC